MKTLLFLTALFFAVGTGLHAAPEPSAPTVPATNTLFRIVFKSYDGDPKKDKPEKFSFQIDTIDLRQPSQFLSLGDQIPNTQLKVGKFTFKERLNPKLGELEDVSELTVINVKTGATAVLVLNRVTEVSAVNGPR